MIIICDRSQSQITNQLRNRGRSCGSRQAMRDALATADDGVPPGSCGVPMSMAVALGCSARGYVALVVKTDTEEVNARSRPPLSSATAVLAIQIDSLQKRAEDGHEECLRLNTSDLELLRQQLRSVGESTCTGVQVLVWHVASPQLGTWDRVSFVPVQLLPSPISSFMDGPDFQSKDTPAAVTTQLSEMWSYLWSTSSYVPCHSAVLGRNGPISGALIQLAVNEQFTACVRPRAIKHRSVVRVKLPGMTRNNGSSDGTVQLLALCTCNSDSLLNMTTSEWGCCGRSSLSVQGCAVLPYATFPLYRPLSQHGTHVSDAFGTGMWPLLPPCCADPMEDERQQLQNFVELSGFLQATKTQPQQLFAYDSDRTSVAGSVEGGVNAYDAICIDGGSPEIDVGPPSSILIHGCSGSGKTALVWHLARKLSVPIISASPTDLATPLPSSPSFGFGALNVPVASALNLNGSAQSALDVLLASAVHAAPSVLLFDQIDVSCPSSSTTSMVHLLRRAVHALRALPVLVVATAQSPESVHPLVSPLFDKALHIDVPTASQRRAILTLHLSICTYLAASYTEKDKDDALQAAEECQKQRNIHTQCQALASVVNDHCCGFVGGDLRAIARRATALATPLPTSSAYTAETSKSTGMVTISEAHMRQALVDVRPMALGSLSPGSSVSAVPKVQWSDIGGLHDVKARLQEAIAMQLVAISDGNVDSSLRANDGKSVSVMHDRHSSLSRNLYESYGAKPFRGILLYGPPGTGKTMLAKAVATEACANFLLLDFPQLIQSDVGGSERAILGALRRARRFSPCVVFMDEMQALFGSRSANGGGGADGSGMLSQLLLEIDTLGTDDVILLGATNAITAVDKALLAPGRFDLHLHVPPPDASSRLDILRTLVDWRPDFKFGDGFGGEKGDGHNERPFLYGVPLRLQTHDESAGSGTGNTNEGVDFMKISELPALEGATGAVLTGLAKQAARSALRRFRSCHKDGMDSNNSSAVKDDAVQNRAAADARAVGHLTNGKFITDSAEICQCDFDEAVQTMLRQAEQRDISIAAATQKQHRPMSRGQSEV